MTGLIPSANGVHNGLPARYAVEDYAAIEEFRNLPQTLADAGYYAGLVGKYHLGRHEKPQLGFQWWTTFRGGHTSSFVDAQIFDNGETYNVLDRDEHLTDFWSRRAVDFLAHYKEEESAEGARPFFLWLSYNGPYILPPTVNQPPVSRHADYYEDNVPAMPQNRVHPYMREWARNNTAPAPEPTEGGTYPWAAIDALNNSTAMINIAAEMTHVDEGIGTVLAALDELGLRDDTLVVFLADQGSSWGQLGLWGNSSWGRTRAGLQRQHAGAADLSPSRPHRSGCDGRRDGQSVPICCRLCSSTLILVIWRSPILPEKALCRCCAARTWPGKTRFSSNTSPPG